MFLSFITGSYNLKQCVDNCFEKYLQSLECIPNPFTTESFVLNHSNQTSLKICDKTINNTIDSNKCVKECPKHCSKKLTKLNLKASHKTFIGDSYMKIKKGSSSNVYISS